MWLPLAAAPAELPPPVPRRAGRHDGALKVLIVDDNLDAADSLAVMLSFGGHDVATANSGPAALAQQASFDPDVVLLDIGMPGMNGYEVAEQWRDKPGGERALLIALTGWGQEEDKRRAMAAGFDRHLTKPVDPTDLHAVLDAAASRRMPDAAPAAAKGSP